MSSSEVGIQQELESRHKKEIKQWEGEKRAAIKKAKSTKGKKAKEVIADLEAQYETKLQQLHAKQKEELEAVTAKVTAGATESEDTAKSDSAHTASATATPDATTDAPERQDSELDKKKKKKQEKARKKREKERTEALKRDQEIAAEVEALKGKTPRDLELLALQQILGPLQLQMEIVPADGHCLYRAVAAQLNRKKSTTTTNMTQQQQQQTYDYQTVRALCADALVQHSEEFAPFCEYNDNIGDFEQYVASVRESAEWGGHLELRVLSKALQRPIWVYSVNHPTAPLIIHDDDHKDQQQQQQHTEAEIEQNQQDEPIRLSFHLQYYALGEHYNHVVPASA